MIDKGQVVYYTGLKDHGIILPCVYKGEVYGTDYSEIEFSGRFLALVRSSDLSVQPEATAESGKE